MSGLLFALTLVTYVVTAAPGLTWLDSPEFVAAAASLGVPHSPGHPLVPMLGRVATLLPVGDVAFRVNLLSGVAMAGAATLLYRGLRGLFRELSPATSRWAGEGIAVSLAAAFALTPAAWMQAVRAEVYALVALLLAGALAAAIAYWRAVRRDELGDAGAGAGADADAGAGAGRRALCTAFLIGLALATHHFITLTLAVPLAGWMIAQRRPARPVVLGAVLAGTSGLAAILYLPIRALRDPLLNWGDPDTPGRLLWTLSGRAFTGSVGADHASSPGMDALQILAALLASNPLLPLLALLGLYMALRTGRGRGPALAAVSVMALCALGRVLIGFDPETPDHHAYLLPALMALTLLATVAVANLVETVPAQRQQITALAAASIALLTAMSAAGSWQRVDHSSATAADELARLDIDAIAPGAVALTSYFQTSFRLSALRAAEGARPDVAFVDRSFLGYPGATEVEIRRHPALTRVIEAGIGPGEEPPRAELDALAQTRPVQIELHFNLPSAYHSLLDASSPMARYRPQGPGADHRGGHRDALELIRERAFGEDRLWATLHILWVDYVSLIHACESGQRHLAQDIAERALAEAPGDELLLRTIRQCELELPEGTGAPPADK